MNRRREIVEGYRDAFKHHGTPLDIRVMNMFTRGHKRSQGAHKKIAADLNIRPWVIYQIIYENLKKEAKNGKIKN